MSIQCRLLSAAAAGAVTLSVLALGAPTSSAAPPDHASRHIIVLRDNAGDPASVAAEHGNRYGVKADYVYRNALKGYAGTIPDARLRQLSQDDRVLFVSDDRPVSIDAQTTPTGITRIGATTSSQLSGDGTGSLGGPAVAVIDTRSGPHADLNIAGGTNCSTGGKKNFADGNGHGTHVAGTIGAKDNNDGVVGVAPGVPLYSVRVLNNSGSGSWSSIVCGIDWVTANAAALKIKVASMSLGGSGSDGKCGTGNKDALHQAICNSTAKGITYVVAAGNESTDFAGSVPATYDEVLTVTAAADFDGLPGGNAIATCRSDVDETAADFSNWAVSSADAAHTIAAPGVCILSTWKGGGTNTISGTSMATPHVSGLAALCLASGACSGTPAAVQAKLRQDAAARPASYSFAGAPNKSPVSGRYYGYLAYAGGY